MNFQSFHLRTEERGKFNVCSLLPDNSVHICLPHRVSFILDRMSNTIVLSCDLGQHPGDDILICKFDLMDKDYKNVTVSQELIEMAKSFDCHPVAKWFVPSFVNKKRDDFFSGVSAGVFGKWTDQVYINFPEPFKNPLAHQDNIEFSIFREQFVELPESGTCKLAEGEDIKTLVISLKLDGKVPHYFVFAEWHDDELLRYGKNFYYNRTVFPKPG